MLQGIEPQRPPRPELLELLRSHELFGSFGGPILAELMDAFESLEVSAGTYLVRAGEPLDSLYGVLHGGLRLVRRSQDGGESTIRELYRGEMLGMMGMFIDRPVPLELLVVRDSTLMRLSRARFLSLTQRYPELVSAFARLMSEHLFDLLGTIAGEPQSSAMPRGGNVALFAASADPAVRETTQRLVSLAVSRRPGTRVDSAMVDGALGPGAAAGEGDAGRLTDWLRSLESGTRVLLFEAGPREPAWTARCVRQADRLVVVATPGDRVEDVAKSLARAQAGTTLRRTDLVLVHPAATELPSGTRVWSRLTGVDRIHHVRRGAGRDLERVVRLLMGRPIGVALSGGGARGIAHVGVLAAIVEAGIPIDYICGTSMGAIFAAAAALDLSPSRMRELVRGVFSPPFALYDLTVPISSILAGKKLDRVMRSLYRDVDIEDLWLPFFCVSTDLSRASLVVHDRGSLWQSVRASCSIPGIFPPFSMAGRALVDGGLMDNLPLDLLAERCTGRIIAVDVFPYGDPTFDRPVGRVAALLRDLRSRIRHEQASPPLFDILVRSTLVGSKFREDTAAERLKNVLYLEPPVGSFGILRWRAHEALFEAGYRYAKDKLRTPEFLELATAA